MKNLKQLIKKLIILSFFLIPNQAIPNEPVDIWNINKDEIDQDNENEKKSSDEKSLNINTETVNQIISIEEDQKTFSDEKYLFGIYDPEKNDLSLNMWESSSKEKILKLNKKINNIKLSQDAKKIYNNLILTNAFMPSNFSKNEFLKLKVDWLIKNKDLSLIEQFILNNNSQEIDSNLLNFYLDEYLSNGDLDNACEVFNKIKILPEDDYTSKFQIYCLIYKKQNEFAQIQFDLIKENNFNDKFFEEKFNFLMGYSEKLNQEILENNILDFHLSRITHDQFVFEPDDNTKENIWRYLKSFNLLQDLDQVDIENDDKIVSIENATHNMNYSEKDLLNLYTRYRFSLQQLLNIEDSHKLLPKNQSRALLYQGILLSKDDADKIKLLQILKESFKKSKIENAFNKEFIKILEQINEREIPNKYRYFYNYYLNANQSETKKIKYNNKILHQSKLINYFSGNMELKTSEKELKKILKKIKNNKKYFFSLKDKILVESLISDGLSISEKDQEILELFTANIPTDIEVMINDGELAMIILRLIEIIGEDNLTDIGTESLYFIIATLNKLNVDKIRNEIILKVLPLKI
tara:strand:- start:1328 stop:3067 length:1740 start_codon:yes stop_codon:yes gene_type:complete